MAMKWWLFFCEYTNDFQILVTLPDVWRGTTVAHSGWRDGLVVSALDQRSWVRVRWLRAVV